MSILLFINFQVFRRDTEYEFSDALQSCEIVLVFSTQPLFVSEMLHKLNIGVQVLKDLLILYLHERVDAGWKEHVGAVWLTVETRFLQHDGYHSAEIYEHRQFGLGCLILVQLHELLYCVFDPDGVYSRILTSRKV